MLSRSPVFGGWCPHGGGSRFYTARGKRYNYILWGGTERLNNPGCFRSIPHDFCPLTYWHLLTSDFNLRVTWISIARAYPVQAETVPSCISTSGAFRDVVCKHR